MKKKLPLFFGFLAGALCADVLTRAVFLFNAWNGNGLGGVLAFLVEKSGLWLTVSVLFCAITLAVSLFGKLSGKAGGMLLIIALASGMTEWGLFHLRILPGKAGVYAFFISVPLFFLAEAIGAVFCAKAAFHAVLQNNSH